MPPKRIQLVRFVPLETGAAHRQLLLDYLARYGRPWPSTPTRRPVWAQSPVPVLHPPEFNHALKELDAAAQAVAETPQQVVEILQYVTVKE